MEKEGLPFLTAQTSRLWLDFRGIEADYICGGLW